MINEKSIEIYTLTEDREKRLWQDCIFIFDSSALLEFYSYSDKARESIFQNIFPKLVNRLWIPQQVEYEYLKNRENVITKPIGKYQRLIERKDKNDGDHLNKIEKSIVKISTEIKEIHQQFTPFYQHTKKRDKHPYFEDESLVENFDKAIKEFKETLESQICQLKNKIEEFKSQVKNEISNRKREFEESYHNDPVLEGFKNYFEVGRGYSFEELMEIAKEGELRYRLEIPPGYEDQDNKDKIGISIYGDLIIWKQIIEHIKTVNKHVILIINDVKIDWCLTKKDDNLKIDKPRAELIKEFHDNTGMEFWMYTFSDFLYKASIRLNTKVDDEVLGNVKEIENEQLKQKEEELAKLMIPRLKDFRTIPSYHHPQEQDFWQEEVEVESSIGQRLTIRTNLLRVYPENFNSYDAYMDIRMSVHPDIQKVISPRLGKTWKVIAGPTESPIIGYFRGDYTDNNPPAWVFGLGLIQEEIS